MPGDKVRADYDELAKIASLWLRESEGSGQMVAALRREMAVLEKGDWVGPGATAFFAEMNTSVLPAVQRLTSALSEAGQVSRRISDLVRTAEGDAARVLRGNAADAKLPSMGVSKDQIEPSGSNTGAIVGGIVGGVLGGGVGQVVDPALRGPARGVSGGRRLGGGGAGGRVVAGSGGSAGKGQGNKQIRGLGDAAHGQTLRLGGPDTWAGRTTNGRGWSKLCDADQAPEVAGADLKTLEALLLMP